LSKKAIMKKTKYLLIICVIITASAINTTAYAQTKWVAPASAEKLKNPYSCDPTSMKDAKAVYTSTCAPCHGLKGRGDGPAAVALNPKPADHSSKVIQAESDGSLYWKLTEGKGAMQSYKSQLSDKQRWGLVCFIRSLKK
jgi:mono/diheme cytochrome c family protein